MDQQHVSNFTKGSLYFTGLCLVVVSGVRLNRYLWDSRNEVQSNSLSSRLCTLSMGAFGFGLSYAAFCSV